MINQLGMPVKGETIAIMHTSMGDIKIKFFKEVAPLAVENFLTHAQNGYYNGIVFHRVINDFMIQGGDPSATGCGGKSIWGKDFKDEFSYEAHNYRGALSMANAGPGTNGSQFFIVQAKSVDPRLLRQMRGLENMFSKECVEDYVKVGGTPHLDYHHTVFGQVFEGMDIVDKIAAVRVDHNDRPLTDVVINNIDVLEY